MRKSSTGSGNGLPPQTAKIAQVIDDLLFVPNMEQRRVKAAFWAKYASNPLSDLNKITAVLVNKIVDDNRIPRWWSMYGFREWFLNEDEYKQRLEYIAHLALDTLEDVLTNPDANQNAKVNAAKLVMEAANKMPQKWQNTKYLDDSIQKMDQVQLEQYIRQRSLLNTPEETVRASASEETEVTVSPDNVQD